MKKILVIEDEEDILNLVKIILEISGYEVMVAHDGYQGLELVKNNPDLIILDLMMPGMTGCRITSYNVCYTKLLRQQKRLAR